MSYYMAYGSNLNKMQMHYRCPDAVPVGATTLEGWELLFRRGFLTIERKPGGSVPVVVWAISDSDEKSLDRYEGYPRFYYKKSFPILLTGRYGKDATKEKAREAMAYIMTDGYPAELPSTSYLNIVREGYEDFGIDTKYLMYALTATNDKMKGENNEKV